MNLEQIVKRIQKHHSAGDVALLRRAYAFAEAAHDGQNRISGEPYISHPLEVALILSELDLDVATLVAALLHDVVEDTQVELEVITSEFGEEVALIIDGVTKLSRLEFKSKEEAQAENLRKMFLAMAKDIRVLLIKLADRLHNMRTLVYHSEEKQREIAQETLEIFVPLAHRLGIFRFKWELEDLSFLYLEPGTYHELARRLKVKRKEREEYVHQLIERIEQELEKAGLQADIAGRPKNLYSIYTKMLKQGKDLDEIYDKIAIRVIVDSVRNCYGALGIIHTLWKPLPGRFKDYIAMPKPNMYQSLHTTLIGLGGEPFEVQIRTCEMHRTAEYGIAAHWRYKEGKPGDKNLDEKLSWLRQILEWQQEVKDTREFMESLRIDLFADTVFVFTPKGDVIELPRGACPVDFAYRVHTEVGHHCVGATVNGRLVPLDCQLANGDIVRVMTSKQSTGPSRDWLNFVKTSQSKARIRHWFRKEKREENVIRGRDLLEQELNNYNLDAREFLKEETLLKIGKKFSLSKADDLFAALGDGSLTTNQVIGKLTEDFFRQKRLDELLSRNVRKKSTTAKRGAGVTIKGIQDLEARFAHCCNPLPGDKIIGYITRGRGVSVHRRDCPNVQAHRQNDTDRERLIEVEWDDDNQGVYTAEVEVVAIDRPRLTMDVMAVVAEAKIPINSIFSRAVRKTKLATIKLKVEIKDPEHLQAIMQRISQIRDVMEVRRVIHS
ncbi:MAG: bifunctional (p)ppGpp synthetase/guanosine-3',5'-bis(diphosphate) 3'-pyrophosphohydrolase [Syntrophomonadaceae bacterium]|nr:bifunctional (p)ppGpp synthetase/guanosine-3',5'-bis(diphosphate) 3'-pyrophosphohydrolase [Syntrophomonadaceae bacterium]